MKNNPFSFKYEMEMMEIDPNDPHKPANTKHLDKALKRIFIKKIVQMVIGTGIGLTLRYVLEKKLSDK